MSLTVGLLVVWFVAGTAREAWAQLASSGVALRWPLLVAAGVVYLAALAPMAWYWWRVVAAVDRPVGWRPLLAAYFAGHLGKYVPGKAMVVVIRTAMLRRLGGEPGPLAASVVVETLTMMATGAAIAAGLLLAGWAREAGSPWLVVAAVGMALAAAAPTLPPVLKRIVARLDKTAPPPELPWRLLATGWAAAAATWAGLSVSLWFAVLAVVDSNASATPVSMNTAAALLLATTLPYVAGFLSLIPGGLLVRDALMLKLLSPLVGDGPALAATAATRLVWIAAELAVYTGLNVVRRRDAEAPPPAGAPSAGNQEPTSSVDP